MKMQTRITTAGVDVHYQLREHFLKSIKRGDPDGVSAFLVDSLGISMKLKKYR
ncbi:MAG: hypothetical protein JXA11_01570 [Phycisphaerae bacterium]|nr:hypothetical protein [Phycisphaerae bacterium]